MTISTEQLGRELARQIYMLAAMKDEKKKRCRPSSCASRRS